MSPQTSAKTQEDKTAKQKPTTQEKSVLKRANSKVLAAHELQLQMQGKKFPPTAVLGLQDPNAVLGLQELKGNEFVNNLVKSPGTTRPEEDRQNPPVTAQQPVQGSTEERGTVADDQDVYLTGPTPNQGPTTAEKIGYENNSNPSSNTMTVPPEANKPTWSPLIPPLKTKKDGRYYFHKRNVDPAYQDPSRGKDEFDFAAYVTYALNNAFSIMEPEAKNKIESDADELKNKHKWTDDQKAQYLTAEAMKKAFKWTDKDCESYLNLNSGVIKVIKVEDNPTDEAYKRENYKLQLGSPITQGPKKEPFDTSNSYSIFSKDGWSIFVMDSQGQFFAGQHKKWLFHHSSFLAGGPVAGAGELKATNGKLEAITNKSGHYKPGENETMQVLHELDRRGILKTTLKLDYVGPDGQSQQYNALKFYKDRGKLKATGPRKKMNMRSEISLPKFTSLPKK